MGVLGPAAPRRRPLWARKAAQRSAARLGPGPSPSPSPSPSPNPNLSSSPTAAGGRPSPSAVHPNFPPDQNPKMLQKDPGGSHVPG